MEGHSQELAIAEAPKLLQTDLTRRRTPSKSIKLATYILDHCNIVTSTIGIKHMLLPHIFCVFYCIHKVHTFLHSIPIVEVTVTFIYICRRGCVNVIVFNLIFRKRCYTS